MSAPTILVVDDAVAFREPIAMCLRAKGYQVLEAANGREAVEVVRSRVPDLVLLDLVMPVMDGLELLERMRTMPACERIAVIVLTAYAEKEQVVRAAKLGVRDYLLKSSFSLQELLERVFQAVPMPPAMPEPIVDPRSPGLHATRRNGC